MTFNDKVHGLLTCLRTFAFYELLFIVLCSYFLSMFLGAFSVGLTLTFFDLYDELYPSPNYRFTVFRIGVILFLSIMYYSRDVPKQVHVRAEYEKFESH